MTTDRQPSAAAKAWYYGGANIEPPTDPASIERRRMEAFDAGAAAERKRECVWESREPIEREDESTSFVWHTGCGEWHSESYILLGRPVPDKPTGFIACPYCGGKIVVSK